MGHQVFLSYSTKDAVFAEKIYDYLTGHGLVCWMAPRSIAPGSQYGEAIIAGIEQAQVFVLVYSEHSNQSQHVLREVERCVNKNIPLIAYKIEEVQPTKSMEYFLMANQWMEAADAPEGHLGELCDAVTMLLKLGSVEKEKEVKAEGESALTGGRTQKEGGRVKIGRRKIAMTCFFLVVVAAVAVVFLCVKNAQTGCGGDVPDMALSLRPGEYITFGRYYPQGQEKIEDARIQWIVLSVDAQAGTALLLTQKLIDMKPYDVAESGVYGRGADGSAYDRTKAGEYSDTVLSVFYGNSSWEYSNLRAWLNSADSVVNYAGQEPVSKGTDDGVNGYQNQAGFLFDFTEEELDRLVVTQVETPANSIENASVTQDRVFLLSVEEAELYLDGQKISRYAAPTDAAIAASRGTIYPLYHSFSQETIPWYFRTPATDSAHEITLCGSGFAGEDDVLVKYACSAGCGVRPAIVINLRDSEFSGGGTRVDPYEIDGE